MLTRLAPKRWRGSKRERDLRDYLIDVVKRATEGASGEYERWSEAILRLHNQSAENRLRGMALAEVKMLVESHFIGLAGFNDQAAMHPTLEA
jgi:hypothetical protein